MSTCSITICRRAPARDLALAVDVVRIGFFAYMSWLMWRYVAIVARERMVTVDLPRRSSSTPVFAGFVLMMLRSIQVFVGNHRRGYSVLERPAAFDTAGS